MEFDYIGTHCAHLTCNQRDFLPFKCDLCGKSLCLLHRTYQAHDCPYGVYKDMTSMDCPVCHKTIKFDKSQDPNNVWDDHFNLTCTQIASNQQQNRKKCSKNNCTTFLGPSNTFHCTKCNQNVCLSHRIPEEHDCAAFRRTNIAEKYSKQNEANNSTHNNNNKSISKPSVRTYGPKKVVSNGKKTEDMSNTLRGSATRRMITQQGNNNHHSATSSNDITASVNSIDSEFICPFCGLKTVDSMFLQSHVDKMHGDFSTPNDNKIEQSCPMCSKQFTSDIELIQHCDNCDKFHSESKPANNKKDCIVS